MGERRIPGGVAFVFDGGVLDRPTWRGWCFADGEIVSAAFHTLVQARKKMKASPADHLGAALDAVEQGITALRKQGRRVF